jgi:tRNA (cytidine/uridine-2'-O-)-methyltransferase
MPHNLHVVLVEPQIPANTGSVGRVCVATESSLHLIEPMGFEVSDAQVKRAGLDYWQYVSVTCHKSLRVFMDSMPQDAPKAFFSTKATRSYFEHRFEPGSYLFFGSETAGLPGEILTTYSDQMFRIPQYDPRIRSLNLANSVSIVVYEALRQLESGNANSKNQSG